MERAMKEDGIDFIQLTYNLTHREVEERLLPLARERGVAVIVNRPYDGGRLIKQLKREKPVPEWAAKELGCRTWADVLLKFIVSHPAVTCAIPATTRVEHMRENMMAGRGTLPELKQRKRIVREMASL
jgi:aryl-alcohol dehydrogenase-like predicted oxidoreductase